MKPLRRLVAMIFRRSPVRSWLMPRSGYDYASSVGDGTGSSTVMAPLLWVVRTFPEAPPAMYRQLDTGQEDVVRDHPLLRLLQRPNEHYTGPILWMATVLDWQVDGNAYWLKIRNGAGAVKELWWAPHWMVEPKGDERTLITHYEYDSGDGRKVEISPADVVHFRFGLDSQDPRKGYSPLKSVLREVFTDDEAANFTASLLRNMGVPGLVVSPDGDAVPSQEDVEATKAYIKTAFGGDKRGETLVMSGPTKIQEFGFSPEQLALRDLRSIPEERVSAVLGVPAIVAGLGAGLARSTFMNMSEAREMAYESNIIPSQRLLGEDIRFQLLPDFVTPAEVWVWRFGFDLSKVRVLQEDVYRQAQRLDLGVRGGWVQVGEARRHLGFEVTDADAIYLRQVNLAEVRASDGKVTPLAQPAGTGANGNGGGGPSAREIAETVVREIEMAGARAAPTDHGRNHS